MRFAASRVKGYQADGGRSREKRQRNAQAVEKNDF